VSKIPFIEMLFRASWVGGLAGILASKILAIIITDEIHIDWLSLVLQMCCLQLTPLER